MEVTDCVLNKQYLKVPTVDIKEIWGQTEENGNYFCWKISNIRNLKRNVEYNSVNDEANWMFSIIKRRTSYDLTITTIGYNRELVCSLCYSQGSFSSDIIADNHSQFIRKVNLPNNIINVPENKFLQADTLVIILKFNKDVEILKPTLCLKNLNDDSTYQCLQNLLKSTREKSHSDFSIHVQDKELCVHKAVLAARSSFFRQYIEENCAGEETGKITIDSSHEAVYAALSFIYCGHAVIGPSDDLIRIFDVARKFGLTRLRTLIEKRILNILPKKRR